MSKEIWCWEYGETIYRAESLKALIHEVINQNFYDGNDWDWEGIFIEQIGNSFNVAFTEEHDECFTYTVEATPEAVAKFLQEVMELKERIKRELEEKYDQWGNLRKEMA